MSKLSLTPRKLIKLLIENGFRLIRQKGSHAIYRHFGKNRRVVVPMHGKDIPTGTLCAILKDAGIDLS